MQITRVKRSRLDEVDFENLGFGEIFSDHMLLAEFRDGEWGPPQIVPYGKMEIFPAMCSLHYAQIVFEGLKAFRSRMGAINVFRSDKYFERMNRSCQRLCIPEVKRPLFMDGIKELVNLDREWVPKKKGYSLYIRPFVFATDNFLGVKVSETYRFMIITSPVGAYYKEGMNPVKLTTPGEYIRAAKGGLGAAKTPANYAATLFPAEEAKKKGFTQVLWLDGFEKKYIEEVGTMNIFFLIGDELITPPLEGTILGGITRETALFLARHWNVKVTERRISIDEVLSSSKKNQIKEAFGTGTAAVISPVGEIQYGEERIVINQGRIGPLAQKLYDEITGIQYGERPDKFGWSYML
ncbi:MAG: branched chain amino acid aminotransferase [Deltaproteobacteria bacterium RBG_13_52_11b]|nr:MAG: branched chain amino acid aminotransferase [Deltaproteobacteria bacterium RBG_13_52_11b]